MGAQGASGCGGIRIVDTTIGGANVVTAQGVTMSETVTFSSVQLIINGAAPNRADLEVIFRPRKSSLVYENNTLHNFETEILQNRFFWLYSNFGKAMPHRNVIFDMETHEESENPRTHKQIEPTDQFFSIFDDSTGILYISSLNKKSFFRHFAGRNLSSEAIVEVKNVYKSLEDFIASVQEIKSISFTGYRDLLTQGSDLMSSYKNIFGLGEPEDFTLEATYNQKKENRVIESLKNFRNKQKRGEIRNLVCIGKDDKNFEAIYNSEKFIERVQAVASRDEQSLLLPKDVKNSVIQQLIEKSIVSTS